MEKEIYTFKNVIEPIVDKNKSKIWINQKKGKRLHCIYKYGTEQFSGSQKIFENDEFIILGQNINSKIKRKIKEEIYE